MSNSSFISEEELHPQHREILHNCSTSDPNSSYYVDFECSRLLELFPLHVASASQPWWTQLIVQILYGIVCCVGILGNSLVIYVVVRFSKMQTVTNLYIVNLAIADECFLVGIPFLMTTIGLGYWPFGNIVCKAYFTSTSINQITSSMFLLIMSADRYLAVCHPISAPKWRTPLIAKFVALTAWTLSALIMVPIYMINCNIFWPDSETWKGESIFIIYSFIISFAIPLTLIMIFYVLVILKLKTVGPKRRPLLPPSGSGVLDRNGRASDPPPPSINHLTPQQLIRAKDRKRSHKKVTKLVLTVITVYFICWAPYWVTQMALIYMPHDSYHSETMLTLFLLAGCFSYSNSTMNPILYAFLSDNFKKSFLKACTCAKGQDVNAQLQNENSVFPRGKKSEKGNRKVGASGTSGGLTGQGNNTTLASGGMGGVMNTSSTVGFMGANNLLQVPPASYAKGGKGSFGEDESGESEEEDEGVLSSSHSGRGGMVGGDYTGNGGGMGLSVRGLISVPLRSTPSTSTTGYATVSSSELQSTFIQDGVHVTAL